MKKLLIATTNPGKFKEYKILLSDLPLKLISLGSLKINKKTKEDRKTFFENAILKAKFYSKLSSLPALSDDGGLEINYLNGEPGIKSRRWPGHEATDKELISLVLKKMKGLPREKRKAQLRIVLALALPSGKVFTKEAKIRGFITEEPKRLIPGYPFRSVFYLPQLKKVYSELSFKEEVEIGYRKEAVEEMMPALKSRVLEENKTVEELKINE